MRPWKALPEATKPGISIAPDTPFSSETESRALPHIRPIDCVDFRNRSE